jgi:hypothetical protein
MDPIPDGVFICGDRRAIASTGVPDADAMTTIARRTRIDSYLPRRTICCSR